MMKEPLDETAVGRCAAGEGPEARAVLEEPLGRAVEQCC